MKNYLIIGLCAGLIMLVSFVYRYYNTPTFSYFPIPESLRTQSPGDAHLYLFLFFSKTDCVSCLEETITVLNSLPVDFFCVAGIVPNSELKDEIMLRRLTGASFPLFSNQSLKKYMPPHTPMLLGVSGSGQIVLLLPGLQKQGVYLEDILFSLQGKLSLSAVSPSRYQSKNKGDRGS